MRTLKNKAIFTSFLLVFVLALAGCASEASPTTEPTEPTNENTNREEDMENQTNAEISPATEPTPEIRVGRRAPEVFRTPELFLDAIQSGTLHDGRSVEVSSNLANNTEQLLFPQQEREAYPLQWIEYNPGSGAYTAVHRLDGVARIRIWFEVDSQFKSIHEYTQWKKDDSWTDWTDYKIFEVIDDKYLLTKSADERSIGITWFDGDREISFWIENWGGRTVDRERFFEIFENFRFVDFATMQREVLGQSAVDAE